MLSRLRERARTHLRGRIIPMSLLVAGLVLLVAQTASAQHRGAAPFIDDGTVTLAFDGAPADLDPANNESEYATTVTRNIDDTLVRLASSTMSSYEPDLATSWSANANKSVWVFHLRHGVRFHTGRCCLTASDVQYSFTRFVRAGLAGSYMLGRFLTDPTRQIKVLDPYTIEFDLGRPQPFFLNATGNDFNAPILDAQALKAHRTKSDPWAHAWAQFHDMGTGPYTIQSWTHGQQMVLTRFKQYWDGWSGPHFSTVVLSTVPDATTRRELIERGKADLTFDLTPQDYDALKKTPGVRVIAPYATEVMYVVMTEAGPLASPYARQALSYAFNYNALIDGIYHGYAKRAYGPIPSTLLGFDPHTFLYHTDLAKARELLAKAGVKPGTTLTYAYFPAEGFGPMGEILQAQLAQIGITVKLQQLDNAAWYSIFYGSEPASQRPNLFAFSWWPDYDDPYDMANPFIASSQQPPNGSNGGMYHDAAVDALLAKMQYANPRTVVEDAHALQNLTSRVDPPAIWAAEPAQATVLAANLRGFVFNPVELRTFYFYPMHH
jgi:peptide/nickel transport system substrate-binding protein